MFDYESVYIYLKDLPPTLFVLDRVGTCQVTLLMILSFFIVSKTCYGGLAETSTNKNVSAVVMDLHD